MKKYLKQLNLLKKKKIKICVITNQSGVARGYYTERHVIKLHKKMNNFIFKRTGYRIDNFEYCPYLRSAKIKKYKKDSYRRKPNPGMIDDYLKKENLEKKNCLLFGDRYSDILCAKNAGIKGYLTKNKDIYKLVKNKIFYK